MALLQNVIQRGTHAARPAAGSAGIVYFESDTGQLFRDSGSVWQLIDLSSLFATKGDLLVGTGSGTVAKLAAGTDTYVLTADSAQTDGIKWAAAGSAGALVQIAQTIVTGSVAASVTFSSIAGSYSSLRLTLMARGDTAAGQVEVYGQFNGDTGANYVTERVDFYSSAATGDAVSRVSATSLTVGYIPANTAPASVAASADLLIPDYARTTWKKTLIGPFALRNAAVSAVVYPGVVGGFWDSTAAITQVTLFPSSGNFAIGSVFTLYGLS